MTTRGDAWSSPVIALLLGVASGCGGGAQGPSSPHEERPYPGIIHPAVELSPDFVVEQHVEAKKDGRGGEFDAVLQKRGGELVLVGLGPASVRAFVLKQQGTEAVFEQSFGPKLPFPPRNVLIDIHRVFFKALPVDAQVDGERRGTIDDEDVVEIWRGGELVERRYARAEMRPGVVRVLYGPGCKPNACRPSSVRLVNEWYGYELVIENRAWHEAPP